MQVRTLTRLRVNRQAKGDGGAEDKKSDVMRVPAEDPNDGNGPLHVLLDFDPESDNAPLASFDNATLSERVRKLLRRNGVRCNLTLQLVPADEGTRSLVHATPLRASRALALRHIVQRFARLSMPSSVYVCTPASVHAKGESQGFTLLGTPVSDTMPLVEGAQRVVIVPPTKQMRLSVNLDELDLNGGGDAVTKRDVQAFEKLKVTLEPFSEDRIHVLADAAAVGGELKKLWT